MESVYLSNLFPRFPRFQDLKDWVKNDCPYKKENNKNKVLKAIDDFDASYPRYTKRIQRLHILFTDCAFPESFNTYLYFQLFDDVEEVSGGESGGESDNESVSGSESESEID